MAAEKSDGHVLVVHGPDHHAGDSGHCMFCDGGLGACSVCGAFEGAWPDECPDAIMTREQFDAVYAGTLNFRDGQWREGECCQVMRHTHDVVAYAAEHGYCIDESGRWVRA